MPQLPIHASKGVSIYQNVRWNVAISSRYFQSGQKTLALVQIYPEKTIWLRKIANLAPYLGPFGAYLMPQ